MDRVFLEYYEDELTHLRELSSEFAALHPTVAGNLSLDTVPCPDPYVERLLEGVSFLNARTKLKIDAESSRLSRNILEALYPDLVTPAPAVSDADDNRSSRWFGDPLHLYDCTRCASFAHFCQFRGVPTG